MGCRNHHRSLIVISGGSPVNHGCGAQSGNMNIGARIGYAFAKLIQDFRRGEARIVANQHGFGMQQPGQKKPDLINIISVEILIIYASDVVGLKCVFHTVQFCAVTRKDGCPLFINVSPVECLTVFIGIQIMLFQCSCKIMVS